MSNLEAITTNALLNVIEQLLNIDEGTLTLETLLVDVPGWDSMGVLLLMAEMDERFGITLNEATLSHLKVVKDIVAIVRNAGHLTE